MVCTPKLKKRWQHTECTVAEKNPVVDILHGGLHFIPPFPESLVKRMYASVHSQDTYITQYNYTKYVFVWKGDSYYLVVLIWLRGQDGSEVTGSTYDEQDRFVSLRIFFFTKQQECSPP